MPLLFYPKPIWGSIFKPAPETSDVAVGLAELGFTGKVKVRDLWEGTDAGTAEGTFVCKA